jgi:hypothetical protein
MTLALASPGTLRLTTLIAAFVLDARVGNWRWRFPSRLWERKQLHSLVLQFISTLLCFGHLPRAISLGSLDRRSS